MPSDAPDNLLRTTLRLNALFSLISGVCMFVADGLFAALLGTLDAVPTVSALGLVVFAFGAFVFWLSRQEVIAEGLAKLVIGADLGWVLASWLALAGTAWFSTQGMWTVAIVADIVLAFAIFQWLGLRRIGSAQASPA